MTTKIMKMKATIQVFIPRDNDPDTGDMVQLVTQMEIHPAMTAQGVLRELRPGVEKLLEHGRNYVPKAIITPDAPKLIH